MGNSQTGRLLPWKFPTSLLRTGVETKDQSGMAVLNRSQPATCFGTARSEGWGKGPEDSDESQPTHWARICVGQTVLKMRMTELAHQLYYGLPSPRRV